MTLPEEFVSFFNNSLTQAKRKPKELQLLTKEQYKYSHERDFIYGQRTGYFLGMLLGWWLARYPINPTEEEWMEIMDMFQEHLDEIKRSVSGLKD